MLILVNLKLQFNYVSFKIFFLLNLAPLEAGCIFGVLTLARKEREWLLGRHISITATEAYRFVQKDKNFFPPDINFSKIYTDFSRREIEWQNLQCL